MNVKMKGEERTRLITVYDTGTCEPRYDRNTIVVNDRVVSQLLGITTKGY